MWYTGLLSRMLIEDFEGRWADRETPVEVDTRSTSKYLVFVQWGVLFIFVAETPVCSCFSGRTQSVVQLPSFFLFVIRYSTVARLNKKNWGPSCYTGEI